MSGGSWDYIQHRFTDVADDIDKLIEINGMPKTKEELKEESWYGMDIDWYDKYPEELNNYKYSDEIIEEFKKGSEVIKIAQIYMQRIDYLLSGDDGDESFLRRLKEDLKNLKQ